MGNMIATSAATVRGKKWTEASKGRPEETWWVTSKGANRVLLVLRWVVWEAAVDRVAIMVVVVVVVVVVVGDW